VFYFLERPPKGKEPDDGQIRRSYHIGGLEDSMYWAGSVGLSMGSDNIHAHTPLGKLFNTIFLMATLIYVSILGGVISSSLTLNALSVDTGIQGLNDLVDKIVGVVNQTTADQYMTARATSTLVRFDTQDDMLDAFYNHKAYLDAVVHDAPTLRYWVNQQGFSMSHLVGEVFSPQSYGIAYPFNSALRALVDIELVSMQESSEYNSLYQKWFGESGSQSSGDSSSTLFVPLAANVVVWVIVACFVLIAGVVFLTSKRKRQRKIRNSMANKLADEFLTRVLGRSLNANPDGDDEEGGRVPLDLMNTAAVDELLREVRDLKSMMADIIESNENKITTMIENNNIRMNQMLDEFRGGHTGTFGYNNVNSRNNLTTIKAEGVPTNSAPINSHTNNNVTPIKAESTPINFNNIDTPTTPASSTTPTRGSSHSFLARRAQSAIFDGMRTGDRISESDRTKLTSSHIV